MLCPSCQTKNPDHAKLCMECGASIKPEMAGADAGRELEGALSWPVQSQPKSWDAMPTPGGNSFKQQWTERPTSPAGPLQPAAPAGHPVPAPAADSIGTRWFIPLIFDGLFFLFLLLPWVQAGGWFGKSEAYNFWGMIGKTNSEGLIFCGLAGLSGWVASTIYVGVVRSKVKFGPLAYLSAIQLLAPGGALVVSMANNHIDLGAGVLFALLISAYKPAAAIKLR
jgi:hypothetical protein